MNRVDLTSRVSELSGLTLKQSSAAVSATLEAIGEALARGEQVTLHGFGTFSPRQRKPRTIVHPTTGERLTVPGTFGVRFSPAAALKRRLAAAPAGAGAPRE